MNSSLRSPNSAKHIWHWFLLIVLLLSLLFMVSLPLRAQQTGNKFTVGQTKHMEAINLGNVLDKLSFGAGRSAFGHIGPSYQLGALQLTAAYTLQDNSNRGGLTYAGGRYYLSSRDSLTAISYHVSIPAELDQSTQFDANTTGARFSWEHILGRSLKMIMNYESDHRNRDGFTIRSNKLTFQYFF